MKKVIALVVLAAAMTLTAQAQGLKFGVKGGLNITKMSINNKAIDLDIEDKNGFFLGPILKLSLPFGISVDIAALYDERKTEMSISNPATTSTYNDVSVKESQSKDVLIVNQKSLQIPLNLRYNIGLSSLAGLYLAAGPQFGFPLSDKVFKTEVGEYRLKDANLSINFGAGLYLMSHLEVGFTYNLAAGKSGEFKDWKDIDTHNYAWQINAAYYF